MMQWFGLRRHCWWSIIFLYLITPVPQFAQNLILSDIDLEAFVKSLSDNKNINGKITYIWTGMITAITEMEGQLEVTVIKCRWVNNDSLLSYPVILSIKNSEQIQQIKSIGLNNYIMFIINVIDIRDNSIPICVPLFIRSM